MTIMHTRPDSDAAQSDSAWHEVEPGFWVGNDRGGFLGTVEVEGARYFARDSSRRYLGEYRSLAEACTAVQGAPARADQ